MPFIPNVPGVPALVSYVTAPIDLLVQDAINLLFGIAFDEWTILLDGAPAFDFESIAKLGYRKEWVVADYPIEDGSFLSYDKVEMPYELHLKITSGGSEEERQAFIAEIDALAGTTELFTIVSPEKIYENATISKWTYLREADAGVGMIVADITFQEIRLSEPASFSNTQQPGSAGQQGVGNVQSKATPSSIQNEISAAGVM